MSGPLVTLIVPCHDLGGVLEDAVDSVFAQSLRDFEIVVVDDGSTDPATQRLLRAYDWPATRVVALARHAPAAALAAGLESARGRLVGILDPRHALEPLYLEQAAAALEADPGAALATCWLQPYGGGVPEHTRGLRLPDLLASCTVGPAALVRRELLVAAGGFDPQFASGADALWDLWIRLARLGARSLVLPQPLIRLGSEASGWRVSDDRGGANRLVEKHRASHLQHAPAVSARLEELRREDASRVAELAGRLAQAARELERLRRWERSAESGGPLEVAPNASWTSGEAHDRIAQLEAALAAALHAQTALRQSSSWKLTAPLRRVHAWLSRLRAPASRNR